MPSFADIASFMPDVSQLLEACQAAFYFQFTTFTPMGGNNALDSRRLRHLRVQLKTKFSAAGTPTIPSAAIVGI